MEQGIPFNAHLGIKVETIRPGFVRFLLPFREEFIGDPRRPALHGGILSTLIDTTGGAAAWSHCSRDDGIATVDMRVDYMRPAPPHDLYCEAEVKRQGNRVAVVHSMVYPVGSPSTLIAEGRAVYNIRKNPRQAPE
ncbi:MAG: PaaI family thioesterase [Desulfovibrio sp.]|nr:MAG: PaaI family thioesterase [Desulfovibrio sp.]